MGTAGPGRVTGPVPAAPVDGPEARGGEGEEDGRVLGDVLGDALPTPEPGRHQGEGVAPVEGGAGRAEGLPSRPAGLEQHPVGQAADVEEHLVVSVGVRSGSTDPIRRTGRRQTRSARTWASKAS